MKTILCYGDSNTWGYIPGTINFETLYMERYARDERWTGLLQQDLSGDYYVVEEGLNGRTTNVDYVEYPYRNGKTFLPICLYAHAPIDLVVLMLGCNDLKQEFNRSTAEIADGIEALITIIQSSIYGPDMKSPPKILLVGYPVLTDESWPDEQMFQGGIARSKQFDKHFRAIAEKKQCHYLNVAPDIELSKIDGIHLDKEGHHDFAKLLAPKIKEILDR